MAECAVIDEVEHKLDKICDKSSDFADTATEACSEAGKGANMKSSKALPNGKVRHQSDDNGIVPHIMEQMKKIENADDNHNENKTEKANQSENGCKSLCDERQESVAMEICSCAENNFSSELASEMASLEIQEDVEGKDVEKGIEYVVYKSELQMPDIMRLITKDLSEPYSIYTYRYFIHNWPKLCFLAMDKDRCVGAIVCKLDMHKKMVRRGYIAMLAVDSEYRRRKIGSHLVLKAIKAMITDDCDEVVLETEITNQSALRLYENLGFVRDKRLFRYYLNGVDALRLKLWLR